MGFEEVIKKKTDEELVREIEEGHYVDFGNPDYSLLDGIIFNKDGTKLLFAAFSYFAALDSITIPDSVLSIGDRAFRNCTSLITVVIGYNVVAIGDSAFSFCSKLRDIYVSDTIPPICGKMVFEGIPKNCALYIPEGSYTAYSKADGWKEFKHIIELEKDWFENSLLPLPF